METYTMSTFLTSVTDVSVKLFSIVTSTVGFITSNPILLVFMCIAVVGAGVGLFQRLRG